MPEVSIITPLYNGSKTLEETAESIFSQGYNDWEWVMFDDGSSDDTLKLANKIAERLPQRIRVFTHENNENRGTSATRNRAASKSTGRIISFIDQDDIWLTDRLSHQINILKQNSTCAMVWSPALYWYKERSFDQPVGYRGQGLEPGVYEPPAFVRIFLSDLRGVPLPSGSLITREAFDAVKGYEEKIRGSEDVVLWLKVAQRFPIYFDDRVIVKYRKHHDSTLRVARRSGKMNEWDLEFYKWVNDFLKESGADDELIEENEFAYYKTIKRMINGEKYFKSRRLLKQKLNEFPEIGRKFRFDYLLDVALPFDLASRISAKIRFDLLRRS